MDLLTNLDLFSVGITTAGTGILGFAVFFNNRKSATNRAFLLFSLVTIMWGIINYLSYQAREPLLILWLLRFVLFFAVLQSFFLFKLFSVFPKTEASHGRFTGILPLVALGGALVTLTPFVFSRLLSLPSPTSGPVVDINIGIALFGFVAVGFVLFGVFQLLRKMWQATGLEKSQYRSVLSGAVITFFLIIVFNFILPAFYNNVRFIPLGSVFIFPFIVFTFSAIVRYRLLNIKVVSTELLVFVLAVVTLFEVTTSNNFVTVLFRSSVFGLVLAFGILLIRSVLREVEQRERLEVLSKELAAANEELKKLDKVKSEFISIASHQLRAPLTIIKGYISLILEGSMGILADNAKESLQKVEYSAGQLVKLVSDLLDLSRIESGRVIYEFKEGDLTELVESVVGEFRPSAEKRKITLVFDDTAKNRAPFSFDQDKVREVVINLVDNAIKYSPEGARVRVSLERRGDAARLSVADGGMGIRPEDRARLFTKFMRTEEAQKSDPNGMGIGLYFVKRVVEDHGGEVSVESKGLGKGSVFTVELPIKRERQEARIKNQGNPR